MVSKSTDTRIEKARQHAMLSDPQHCYKGGTLLTKAAFLDSWLKTLSFLTQGEKEQLTTEVETEATTIGESLKESLEIAASLDKPTAKWARGEHKRLDLYGDIVQPTEEQEQTITPYNKAWAEVACYSGELFTHKNPLCWWKETAFCYPILSHLARKYLAIPATSAPSKRAFNWQHSEREMFLSPTSVW